MDTVEQQMEFRIDFDVPDGMPSQYATEMFLSIDNHTSFVHFFHIRPPVLSIDPKQREVEIEELSKEGRIAAQCVASLVIPTDKLEKIAETIAAAIQRHKQQSK